MSDGEHSVQLRDESGRILDEQRARVAKGDTARLTLQLGPARKGAR